jgi:hypothetical protein
MIRGVLNDAGELVIKKHGRFRFVPMLNDKAKD